MTLCLLAAAPALAQTTPSPALQPPKWGAHLDLEGKLGTTRALGEGDLFVPLLQNGTTLLFGNVKARMDDSASSEGNYGLGVRHMLESGWNLGTYGFFDRRRTEHANYFNQITVGVEALSLNWDFRANAYIPEGRRSHQVDSLNEAYITGTQVYFRGGEERSLGGFDAEIGYRVPVFEATADRQLRLFAGGYRFTSDSDLISAVQGPRGRVEFTVDEVPGLWDGSRLTIGGEMQNDQPRGNQAFLSARLRIPLQVFGAGRQVASLTPMERRMTDPVVRDIDVVAQAGAFGAQETATQTASGSTLKVITSGTTSGANLGSEVTAAGANSTVILSGTFEAGTVQVNMTAGQTLVGAGSLTVRSPSGRVATLNTNTTATINGSAAATVLQMNSNATVIGLTVNATASGASNALAGIMAGAAGGIKILNSTFTATVSGTGGAIALRSGGANANTLISGNTLTATGGSTSGVVTTLGLDNVGSDYTVTGNTMSGSKGNGTANLVNFTAAVTINAGSIDNVRSGTAICSGVAPASGSIAFTNGTTCP